jgi:hypothetical protein
MAQFVSMTVIVLCQRTVVHAHKLSNFSAIIFYSTIEEVLKHEEQPDSNHQKVEAYSGRV